MRRRHALLAAASCALGAALACAPGAGRGTGVDPEAGGGDAGAAVPAGADDGGVVDGGTEAAGADAGQDENQDAGAAGDAGTTEVECGAFPAVSDVDANGPFDVTTETGGDGCTIVRPTALGQGGVRHPVIVWGNGTDAPVSLYKPAFEYWASHGFIVAAADVLDGQGSGDPQAACLDWVLAQNETAGSPYGDNVCPKVAATGHSQGGAGALMLGRDPRVTVTAPLMPYTQQGWGGFDVSSITDQVASPMLLLSGTLDNNATPSVYQQPVFDRTNVPVFWANRIGADHYTAALGLTNYRATMLAWFRLHLMGDESFRGEFYGDDCALCSDAHWIVQRRGF